MRTLDLAWWAGLAFFAACAASPLLLLPLVGPVLGFVAWVVLAPFTALAGLAAVHRLLPASEPGTFRVGSDAGATRWALGLWAPSVYLAVFQPLYFQSAALQRLVLRAFGAELADDALLTSRTVVREPQLLHVGARSVVGEFVHLATSLQPRPGLLVVGRIHIDDDVLVGGYTHVGPGARIGPRAIIEHRVTVGPHTTIGAGSRIGADSTIWSHVRVGVGVTIGKSCLIASGVEIADGTQIPDGTVVRFRGAAERRGSVA